MRSKCCKTSICCSKFRYKIELVGEEKIGKNIYYNLSVETDVETINYLISKENFQIFRVVSGSYITEFEETIVIDGIRVASTIKSISDNDTRIATYSDYKFNIDINDSVFELSE